MKRKAVKKELPKDLVAALTYFMSDIETAYKKKEFTEETSVVVCCQIGSNNQIIKYGAVKKMLKENFDLFPQSLIVPGRLQFFEEEALEKWKL